MANPRVLVGIALALVLVLVLALSAGSMSGNDIASLIGVGMMVTLMSSFVLAQARGNLSGMLRDLLIWGMIVAAITLIYANKAKFGF